MPRRGEREASEPPKKRIRAMDPSLDVSYTDDEALAPGIVLTDLKQRQWRVGKPIGRGSFGRIYLASDHVTAEVTKESARYVVKMEPHSNGPLFVEVHCFMRTAQAQQIKEWRQKYKQKRLGMPPYIASGSYVDSATQTKYRFLILPRYRMDLQKIIQIRGRSLDLRNVLVLAVQILDVLEYLHHHGYTHSDIKSSNLIVGFDSDKKIYDKPNILDVFEEKYDKNKDKKVKRFSNYYKDDDFVVNVKCEDDDHRKHLSTMKKKLRTILNDRDKRRLHRHHAFNLRQLHSHVNYSDLNSSVCSDTSYQKLIDEEKKPTFVAPKSIKPLTSKPEKSDFDEKYEEAILSQSSGQIYLLDYGLASKFLDSEGVHKEFAMDARKAHDGTLEYSSTDSHIGAHSRRSDLETLGYNLIDWLTGTLPWKTAEMLAEPDLVHCLKKDYKEDVAALLKTCFKTELYPVFMGKYLEYVAKLEFTEKPDYNYCRGIFKAEFVKNGYGTELDMNLRLGDPKSSSHVKKISYSKRLAPFRTNSLEFIKKGVKICERENISGHSSEHELKMQLLRRALNNSNDSIRKPCTSKNFYTSEADIAARLKRMKLESMGKKLSPKNLRSKKRTTLRKKKKNSRSSIGKFGLYMGFRRIMSWAEVVASNPEDILRNCRNVDQEDNCNAKRSRKNSNSSDTSLEVQSPLLQKNYLQNLNPTYAMIEVFNNFRRKNSPNFVKEDPDVADVSGCEGFTPAMIQVLRMIENRRDEEEDARYLLNDEQNTVQIQEQPKTHSKTKSCDAIENKVERQSRSRVRTSSKKGEQKKLEPLVTKDSRPKRNKTGKVNVETNNKAQTRTRNVYKARDTQKQSKIDDVDELVPAKRTRITKKKISLVEVEKVPSKNGRPKATVVPAKEIKTKKPDKKSKNQVTEPQKQIKSRRIAQKKENKEKELLKPKSGKEKKIASTLTVQTPVKEMRSTRGRKSTKITDTDVAPKKNTSSREKVKTRTQSAAQMESKMAAAKPKPKSPSFITTRSSLRNCRRKNLN